MIVTPSVGAPVKVQLSFPFTTVFVAVTVLVSGLCVLEFVYVKVNFSTFACFTGVIVTSPLAGVTVGAVGLTLNVTGLSILSGA